MLLGGRSTRRSSVAAAGALLLALSILVQPRAESAGTAVPLSAVRDLVASVSSDQARISWRAPASGAVARYQVQAFLNGVSVSDYGTRIVSGTSIVWDRMPFNQPVQFTVTPIGPDGPNYTSGPAGPVNDTGTVVATNTYCPGRSTGDCVIVNTTELGSTETRPGAGLLHGTVPSGNKYAKMLHLTHWRIAANDRTEYDNASSYVPSEDMIEVLSDGWYSASAQYRSGKSYAADPWVNWAAYTSFIEQTVRKAERQGQDPYWEIQNEPENYPYSPAEPPTRALVEEEYLHGYRAIKAADPKARVIGPSIDWIYEDPNPPAYIDMKTFIPFAAAHGMRFAAIVWHDNEGYQDSNPIAYYETPQAVRDHAEEVRELIAENPGIGKPLLFVDEESSASGQFSPGWEAGYLAEDDRAGIALSDRSCWDYPGDTVSDCFGPNLGELLNRDGKPGATFWTMVDYATMTGRKAWTESTDTNLSSLAVTDTSGTTRILIGRHQTCSGWTAGAEYCPAMSPPAAIRTIVDMLVPTDARSARISVQEIKDTTRDLPGAPWTGTFSVPVVDGLARVSLPAFEDGEAYFITVVPNSTAGRVPQSGNQTHGETPPARGGSTPTRLISESGPDESTTLLTQFPSPLVALVTDQYGNPMANQKVTFCVTDGYAHFPGGADTATVTSDSQGIANSPPLTAGLHGGRFGASAYITRLGERSGEPVAYYSLSTQA